LRKLINARLAERNKAFFVSLKSNVSHQEKR